MKNYHLLLPSALLMLASCSQSVRNSENVNGTDTLASHASHATEGKALYAKMQINPELKSADPVQLKFTVYNDADTAQTFCKWHTPFEPLMSKYLDIKNENGEEAAYKGPMAKRIMPPPADSYIKVNPKDSLSVTVDLLKGYDLKKSSKYTISYSGQNMSGLIVKDSISFVYGK